MRILLKILGTALSLFFVCIVLLSYILFTRPGLHTAVALLSLVTKDKIRAQAVRGVLARQFEVKNIIYRDRQAIINVPDIRVEWRWKNFSQVSVQCSISTLNYNGVTLPPSQWQGEFYRAYGKFHIDHLTGSMADGKNTAQINLSLKDIIRVYWNIQLVSLRVLSPDLFGQLKSQGNLNGQNLSAMISADALRYKTTAIQNISIKTLGQLAPEKLTLMIMPNQWRFYSTTLGNWFLVKPIEITMAKNGLVLKLLKLRSVDNTLLLSGEWKKNQYWVLHEAGKIGLRRYGIVPKFDFTETGDVKKISYAGRVSSGSGDLTLQGSTKDGETKLTIVGNQFLACDTSEYKVWISPQLSLDNYVPSRIGLIIPNRQKGWVLWGKLVVPKVRVILPKSSHDVITLPNDVVYAAQRSSSKPFPLYSNIQLILGQDVKVNVQGLTGNIQGALMLSDAPDQLATAEGRLTIVHGLYNLYGQALTLQEGNLLFNHSSVSNPGLNIRAIKKIRVSNSFSANNVSSRGVTLDGVFGALTVGAVVTGTLEAPQVNLFSEPSNLSQVDILSYLLLGHPASSASPMDAQILLQATTSMDEGAGKVEQIRGEIQRLFGIDTVDVESINYVDPTSKTPGLSQITALVLKKSLSPRLYLSYSAGLMGALNIFTIKYTLSEHWILQSTTSTFGSGADIFAVWHV